MIFVSFLLHLVVRLGLVRRERHPQLLDAQSEEGEGLVDANNPSIVHFFFWQLSRPRSLIQSQSWRIQPEQIIILDILDIAFLVVVTAPHPYLPLQPTHIKYFCFFLLSFCFLLLIQKTAKQRQQ